MPIFFPVSGYASTESVNCGVIYNVFYAHGLKADKTNLIRNNINALCKTLPFDQTSTIDLFLKTRR